MIGRNFILKIAENFSEHNEKIRLKIPHPIQEFAKKNETISLTYDVNDQLTMRTQSKSPSNFVRILANIEVTRIWYTLDGFTRILAWTFDQLRS